MHVRATLLSCPECLPRCVPGVNGPDRPSTAGLSFSDFRQPGVGLMINMSPSEGSEEGLRVRNLSVTYRISRGPFRRPDELRALRDVDLDIAPGRSLGVVGESGSGKSSMARAFLRLQSPSGGKIVWRGHDITQMTEEAFRHMRPDIQMVFQDPLASLNPRMQV